MLLAMKFLLEAFLFNIVLMFFNQQLKSKAKNKIKLYI